MISPTKGSRRRRCSLRSAGHGALGQLELQACALDRWAARRMISPSCSARFSSGFVQYIVLFSERKSSITFVDSAPGRRSSGEHIAPRPSIRTFRESPFSRSSTQAALLICIARGDNRVHELLRLLLRSRPLGCSCGVARRCFLCPLVYPEVLAPVQSRIPSLSVRERRYPR